MITFNTFSRRNTIEEALKKLNNQEESSISDKTFNDSDAEEVISKEVSPENNHIEITQENRISQMNTHESNKSIR